MSALCAGCGPRSTPEAETVVRSFATFLCSKDYKSAYQMCTQAYRSRMSKEDFEANFTVSEVDGKAKPALGELKFLGDPPYDSVLFLDPGEQKIGWYSQEIISANGTDRISMKIHVEKVQGKFYVDGGGP